MILNLKVENFKQYKKQKFDLSSKITVIIGPNGAGKTSILEAIEFGLFGSVRRKEKQLKNLTSLISYGETRAVVAIEFISPINNRKYFVKRVISKKGKTRLQHSKMRTIK